LRQFSCNRFRSHFHRYHRNHIVNSYTHLIGDTEVGAVTLQIDSGTGVRVGDELLIIQSQGVNAGAYEFAIIDSVGSGSLTVREGLSRAYKSGLFDQVGSEVTQVVRVPHFTNVIVTEGASVSAKIWDGRSGGIIVFRALGAVTIAGLVDASAAGYRSGWGTVTTGQWHHTGEGTLGGSPQQQQENLYGGGGAGFDNSGGYHGGGGGGSHATAGTNGFDNSTSPSALGGHGATTLYGTPELSALFFGGGAAGKAGGGIIWIVAESVNVSGEISARGGDGQCNHNQWGNGEAGAAGGSIYLSALTLELGIGLVQTTGGKPGDASWVGGGDGCGGRAGGGGDGRIRLDSDSLSGETAPTAGYLGAFGDGF